MNSLLVSDLHLTAEARDEYRWQLFDWLIPTCLEHDVKDLYFLGDITDRKDNHNARLVNRIVDNMLRVYRQGKLLGITILRGNHDGIDPDCAYFRFLGKYPCITYIDHPFQKMIGDTDVLFLPHAFDPVRAWEGVEMHSAEIILMHATIRGSLAENGQVLEGVPATLLNSARRARIFSGDVHVPQKVGRIEYVGAPYPVRFGDKFTGRAILARNWVKFESLPIPSIQRAKLVLDVTQFPRVKWPPIMKELGKGDQAKVVIPLVPAQYGEWREIKKHVLGWCVVQGVEVCDLSLEKTATKPLPRIAVRGATASGAVPQVVLESYCETNKVDAATKATGLKLLKGE